MKLLSNMPSGRVNPYAPTPVHIFLCTSCRDELNLVDAFQGEIDTHAGPTPLPFVTGSFDAPVPTTSESDSDVPTQPTDRPAATIIAPASVVLSPKRRWDSRGVPQHVYKFGDVSVVLDSSLRKLGSYETEDDGMMIQHHALFMRSEGGSAKARGLKKLLKILKPRSGGVLDTVHNYCWLRPFSKHKAFHDRQRAGIVRQAPRALGWRPNTQAFAPMLRPTQGEVCGWSAAGFRLLCTKGASSIPR